MTVHFIGAGPGDPDLITVKGRKLIERCPVLLYAGSLVPKAVVACAPKDALVVDTAPLTLDEIVTHMKSAHEKGQDVARVHSGDPSIYGAIAEQMRRLDASWIDSDTMVVLSNASSYRIPGGNCRDSRSSSSVESR